MDKELLITLEQGREAYENRDFVRAEVLLRQVSEMGETYADVMNMLGVIYHDRGQIAKAQEYFERALSINSNYTEAALNLAVTYNDQGRYEEAKKLYSGLAHEAPIRNEDIEPFARGKLANMHAELGRAYAELRLFDNAIEQYEQALELSPNFADIRTRFGQLLKDMGRLDKACKQFDLAKKDRPSYLPARISLGVARLVLGDKEEAKEEWSQVIAIDPENKTASTYLRMVEQLLAQDEADEAGMNLEVESQSPPAIDDTELDFSFEGEKSSVTPLSELEKD